MATDNTVMMMIRASRPTFRNPHDKVAFAVHASCLASGFVLLATGPSAFSDDPFSSAFADEVAIDHWNDFEDNYGFIYSTPEGNSKKVLIKCLVMNGKLLIDALWEGTSAILHLELNVQDYVENGGANYDSQYKNFGKLVEEINKEILSKGSPAMKSSSSGKGGIRDNADRRGAESNDSYQPSGSVPPGYVVLPIPAFGGSGIFPAPVAGVYPTSGIFPAPGASVYPISGIFPAPGAGVYPTSGIFPAPGAGVYPTSGIFPAPGAGVYPTRYIGGYEGMLLGPRDARFFPGISGDPRLPGGSQDPTRPPKGQEPS